MKDQNYSLKWSFTLLALTFSFSIVNCQYFNTRCSDNSQCVSNQRLQCLNGYCQCDSRVQVYDYKLNQCTIRAGSPCHATDPHAPKCSKNSACVLSACQCQPGYSASSEFLCKPNFQNTCRIPQDCQQDRGLICLDGSCQCKNASLSYQGLFGCIDASNPQFLEMMTALKRTEQLLSENSLDLDEVVQDIDVIDSAGASNNAQLQNFPFNQIQARQLFQDSYSNIQTTNTNTNSNTDLLGAYQNNAPQQQGPGLAGFINLFQSLGQLSQLFGGNRQAPAAPPATAAPAQGGGYAPPANGNQGQGNIFSLFTNMLNRFNQLLPQIRRFKMLINPVRIIRKLLMNLRGLRPTPKPGYPASGQPESGYGPPPTGGPPPAGGYGAPKEAAPPAPGPAPPAQAIQQSSYQVQPIQNYQAQQSSFENPTQFQNPQRQVALQSPIAQPQQQVFQTQKPNFSSQPNNFQNPQNNFQNPLNSNNFQNPSTNNFQTPSNNNNFQTPSNNNFQTPSNNNNFQTPSNNNFQTPSNNNNFQTPSNNNFQPPSNNNNFQNPSTAPQTNFQNPPQTQNQNQQFQPNNAPQFQTTNVPQFQPTNVPQFQQTNVPQFQQTNVPQFIPTTAPQNPQSESQPNNYQPQNINQIISDLNDKEPVPLSQNKYPRQERFSTTNNVNIGDDSPYLPEHL